MKAILDCKDGNSEKNQMSEIFFLQSIFDSSNELSFVIDNCNSIVKTNKKFEDFIGAVHIDSIGKNADNVLKNTELNFARMDGYSLIEKVRRTNVPISLVSIARTQDENHWEVDFSPIKDMAGNTAFILLSFRKINERIRLIREIESSEHKFQSFINSAQDWISIKDISGRYVAVNNVTAKAFGLQPEDFIGRQPKDVLPEKLSEIIKVHDQIVYDTKKSHTYEEVIPIDGQDHIFQTVRFPMTDYSGEINGIGTIDREITREVQLQEQLIKSEKLAALGKLAAGVAHEINNPLTGVLTYAEDLLESFDETDTRREDLDVIIRETLRCREIVRNLLDFTRQDKPRFEKSHPNSIVERALLLIKRLPQFRNIEITKVMAPDLPEIQSDPQQIQQVLLNLFLNAADAMHYKGSITISTELDRGKNNCMLSVADSGPGIPGDIIDKIFEPFFSTKSTNGLGLAVSWSIIELHRGTIEVENMLRGGALFRVNLPCNIE
ncbi:MAG: domain S-box protein [Ignavibacteria bacterium]|nr:domain S-box protein [Ignavibacteria bacterium]